MGSTAILAAVAAAATPGHHVDPQAYGGCRTHSCLVRVARKKCEDGDVVACVRRGARQHGIDERRLIRIAWCESTMNPNAVNGQYVGIFQFGTNAWSRTPYRSYSRFSAKWSSLAAGYAFARGRAGEWECK